MIPKHMGIDSGKNSRPFAFCKQKECPPFPWGACWGFEHPWSVDFIYWTECPSKPCCPNTSILFFFLKKTMYLFIWLHWVLVGHAGSFATTLGLYLQYVGSRVCGLRQLWHRDSSCGLWAPECMGLVKAARELSCSEACGILFPWPGIEFECPTLQGGFLTTGSPGKSQHPLSLPCCF